MIPMLPSGTLPLTILVLSYEASGCIPSFVAVLAYLSSFCFLLPTHTMPLLHNDCWNGRCAFIRSVLVSSVWTQPIGARVSLPGFMLCLVLSPSLRGIPRTRRSAPACLPLGPEKNWENAVASSASLDAFFSFFVFNAPLCVAGPRLLRRLP